MPKPAPAASNLAKAAPREVQSSHQPLLTSPEKNPSISDIKKNLLLSSALGREQICSRIQPVKGSLKHCGQDSRTTHGPSGGAAKGAVSLSPPSHTCRPSPHTQGFPAWTKSIHLFHWESPGPGWSCHHWCAAARQGLLRGKQQPRGSLCPSVP